MSSYCEDSKKYIGNSNSSKNSDSLKKDLKDGKI